MAARLLKFGNGRRDTLIPLSCSDHYKRPRRMPSTPPGYCSGFVLILREPHAEHFMSVAINGIGVFQDNGSEAGSTSSSWLQSQQ